MHRKENTLRLARRIRRIYFVIEWPENMHWEKTRIIEWHSEKGRRHLNKINRHRHWKERKKNVNNKTRDLRNKNRKNQQK